MYYRINTVHITLPPLRDRKEDIVPLAELFLNRFAEKYHRPLAGIAPDAVEALKNGYWSGNIRELQNCMEKAVILSEGKELGVRDLDFSTPLRTGRTDKGSTFAIPVENEEAMVRDAMERAGGNISAAAKLLGVSRPTLYAKLKKYGL